MNTTINTRPFDKQIPTDRPVVGVEVGVREGLHAEEMLNHENVTLFCVDPYLPYLDGDVSVRFFMKEDDLANRRRQCRETLHRFGLRAKFVDLPSLKAVESFEQQSLDFVYIDADHSLECVAADIIAWWKTVRIGGVFGGHDYDHMHPSVRIAVDMFIQRTNLKLNVEQSDWWVIA